MDKSKIMIGIAVCSVFVALFIGLISIITSSQIINQESSYKLLYLVKDKAEVFDDQSLQVEKAVDDLYSFIVVNLDYNKLKTDPSYANRYVNQIAPVIKKVAESTSNSIGGYFYFAPELTQQKVTAVWYAKTPKSSEFTKQKLEPINDFNPENRHMDWYYDPIFAKKALWSNPYHDEISEIYSLPYTKPIFINGKFVGLVGMDVAIKDIKDFITGIKIYKTGYAFLVNEKYTFVASKDYDENDNLGKIKNGYYKFLIDEMEKNNSGIVEFNDPDHKQKVMIASFARLSNNFITVSIVPKAEMLEKGNSLKLFTTGITLLGLILVAIIILNI